MPEHRLQNTAFRTQPPEHSLQNTAFRTQPPEHSLQNTAFRTQPSEHRLQNTASRTQPPEHSLQNTSYRSLHHTSDSLQPAGFKHNRPSLETHPDVHPGPPWWVSGRADHRLYAAQQGASWTQHSSRAQLTGIKKQQHDSALQS